MKFGVLHLFESPMGRTDSQMVEEQISLMQTAEDYGYDSIWPAEHHFNEYGVCASPALTLAALARTTNANSSGYGRRGATAASPGSRRRGFRDARHPLRRARGTRPRARLPTPRIQGHGGGPDPQQGALRRGPRGDPAELARREAELRRQALPIRRRRRAAAIPSRSPTPRSGWPASPRSPSRRRGAWA